MDTIFDKYSHLLPVKYHTAFQSAEWAEFEKQHWVKIKALYEANKRKFDPMEIHGVPHIERCLIMANILFQFLGGNSSNSMNRLLSLIAVAFHDAGRTNNGSDIWESQSARLCKQYLLNIGFSTEAALRAEFMILKQEGGMQGDVLHDVDAIEITRLIGKSDFHWNQLHLLKREGVDAQEMKMLLMQLMEFAIEAQDKVIFQANSKTDFYTMKELTTNSVMSHPVLGLLFRRERYSAFVDEYISLANAGMLEPVEEVIKTCLKLYEHSVWVDVDDPYDTLDITIFYDFAWSLLEMNPQLWNKEEKAAGPRSTQIADHWNEFYPEGHAPSGEIEVSTLNWGQYLLMGYNVLAHGELPQEEKAKLAYAMYIFCENQLDFLSDLNFEDAIKYFDECENRDPKESRIVKVDSKKTLSKSDFQLAYDCAKKLVYKKAHYETANDTNEYMKMLAEGGYVIGKMATLYYPEGIEIDGPTAECIAQTSELLKRENVTLFEAAILCNQKLVRVDILEKKGNRINLIEVKSVSSDTQDPKKNLKKLDKYINDVAFQYMVLKEAYPDAEIHSYLFTPSKQKETGIEGLAGWFQIKQDGGGCYHQENEALPAQQNPIFNKPEVKFIFEDHPNKAEYINLLMEDGVLELLPVQEEVLKRQPEIRQKAEQFIRILNEGIRDEDYTLNKKCRDCEFITRGGIKDGYLECWGEKGYHSPHIFDLHHAGSIGHYTKGFYVDELIAQQKLDLFDIDVERLQNAKGEIGPRAFRQIMQLTYTRKNEEWIDPNLKIEAAGFTYPLHFIDFETYTGAVPFHKRMRPYELIAFQWSCHTIARPGATPTHAEWIHTGPEFPNPSDFPNFAFARSLMKQIGTAGTVFMWATHENTVLKRILMQMDEHGIEDEALRQWLLLTTKDKDTGRDGRMVDMNRMTLDYYFHPQMKGKTSIKKVLPAIWSNYPDLHKVPHFKTYAPKEFLEGVIDPYDRLKARVVEDDEEKFGDDAVAGGTDAMRAYYRIRFDSSLTNNQRNEVRRQLLEYCKLDTMAMVIIAHHWGIN